MVYCLLLSRYGVVTYIYMWTVDVGVPLALGYQLVSQHSLVRRASLKVRQYLPAARTLRVTVFATASHSA